MTQSKFKYRSADATPTYFTPQGESKPFQPFDIQAASQPILDALKEDKEIALGNVKRTGDNELSWMRIEHEAAQKQAQHEADVEKINAAYDLDQLKQFSTTAAGMLQTAATMRAEHIKKKALNQLLKLKVTDEETFNKVVLGFDKVEDANGAVINSGALQGYLEILKKDPSKGSSLRLAQSIIDASGYKRKVLREAMLGDQIKLIPERQAFLKENHIPEWTKSEANPNGFTFNQMVKGDPTGYTTDDQYRDFEKEIDGLILERHFIPYHSAQTIASQVLPGFDKSQKDSIANRKAQGLLSEKAEYERNNNKNTATIIDRSYGRYGGWIGEQMTNHVRQLAAELEDGATLSERMSKAWIKKLDNLHDLYDAGGITYAQALKAVHGEFKVDSQGLTSINTWREKEVKASGFWAKMDASMMRKNEINKLNKENIINFGIKAMREQFIANDNRPIEETTFQLLVDKLHKMGGGRRSDIEEKLREAQDTVHGLEVEQELKNLSQDYHDFGKLDPSLYSRYSHESMVQARKNGWLKDPAHIISASELKYATTQISNAALAQAKGVENIDRTNVEIRARKFFNDRFTDLISTKDFKNNRSGAYALALSDAKEAAKKNWEEWLLPLTKEELVNKKAIEVRNDIAENVEQGADVQTYAIPAFDTRMEWLIEKIKKNPGIDWRKLINPTTKYPVPAEKINLPISGVNVTTGPQETELFFDKSLMGTGTGQGVYGFVEQQLRARNFDPDKGSNIKPISPADNTNREVNPSRVDVYHTETGVTFNMPEGGDKLIGKTFGQVTPEEWQDLGTPLNKEFLKRMGFKSGYTIDEKSLQQISERWTRLDQGEVKAPTIFDNPRNTIKHSNKVDKEANRQLGDEKEMNGRIYVYSVITGPGPRGGVYNLGWKLKGGLLGALFGNVGLSNVGPRYLPNKTVNPDGFTIDDSGVPNPRHPANDLYFKNRPGLREKLIEQGY